MTRRSASSGFTLIEIVVTMVLLLGAIVSLMTASRIVAASGHRTAAELRATQLVQDETERLQTIPLGQVTNGSRTRSAGTATWTVTDSVRYLRIDLAIETASSGGVVVRDTVQVYRSR